MMITPPDRPLPLADLRIVAVEQYGAGPFGSLQLADLGAEVIRIEQPEPDVGRNVPPYAHDGDSLFFETFNRNKSGVVIDLGAAEGQRVLHDLVRASDAVYSNLRGDVVGKLGLDYASLGPVNPRVVCCSLSGFGTTGPRAADPALDYMLQARCGWMSLTGEPDGPPTKSGLSLVDYSAGLAAAGALLAGIHAARRDGIGLDCDTSLFDTAIAMLSYVATWQLTRDYAAERQPRSAHPSLTPFQAFRTADGWIVAGGSKEKFWRGLATVTGRPELITDPRYVSFADRLKHRESLTVELTEAFATRTSAAWLDDLTAAGVPCAPVNSVAEALADEQCAARDSVIETTHPRFGTVRAPAGPIRVGARRRTPERAPRHGEHTEAVLAEVCGYDRDRIEALLAAGVIRQAAS